MYSEMREGFEETRKFLVRVPQPSILVDIFGTGVDPLPDIFREFLKKVFPSQRLLHL